MPNNRWAGISGSLALHALAAVAIWVAWRALESQVAPPARDEVPSIMLQEGFAELPDAPGIAGNDMPDSPPPALQEQLQSFAWQPVEIRVASFEPPPAATSEDLGQPKVAAPAPAAKVQDAGVGSISGGTGTSAGGSPTGGGNSSGTAGRGSPSGGSGAGTFGGLGMGNGGRRGGGATLVPLPGNKMPGYPLDSLHRFDEGTVRVRLTVEPSGRVAQVQVVRSSGFEELDAAAVDAVKRWRFETLGISQNLAAEQDIQFRVQGARQGQGPNVP